MTVAKKQEQRIERHVHDGRTSLGFYHSRDGGGLDAVDDGGRFIRSFNTADAAMPAVIFVPRLAVKAEAA
jgi:hypothetical protein